MSCDGCGDRGVRRLARGAVGIVKAEMGVFRVDRATAEARWAACTECEHFDLGMCGKCRCHLSARVWLTSEGCPVGRWPVADS